MILTNRKAFTLMELLVVVAMIGVILGAMTFSVRSAQERARIQKATSDVKIISQAILARENYGKNGKYELEPMGGEGPTAGVDADASTLATLIGKAGVTDTGDKMPALLMASLQSGGKMLDPWGTPYKIVVKVGVFQIRSSASSMMTGSMLPNFYRLSAEEREQ